MTILVAVTDMEILLTEKLFFSRQKRTTKGSSFFGLKKKIFGQKIAV